MNQLTEQLKEQYRKDLEYDPKEDFYSEFDRTAELQMQIISSHGFEGLKLVLKNDNIYPLGNFPADCPWSAINNLEMDKAIEMVFSIQGKLVESGFIDEIKERCFFIFSERKTEGWTLSYVLRFVLYTNKEYYTIVSGGEPLSNGQLQNVFAEYGWEVPQDLGELYKIHNGFYKDGETLVNRAEHLSDLQEIYPDLDDICGIDPGDVLRIADDGAGNLIAYVRNHEFLDVIDIDHETLEITDMYGLYGYLDSRFENLDEIDSDEDFDDDSDDDEDDEEESDDEFTDDAIDSDDYDEPYTEIKFSKRYSITSTGSISAATILKYKDIAPPALIHLWETQGLPRLNNGILTFINPEDYITTLDQWLGKHKDNYLPFAVGAFGNLFYYRKLTKDEEDVCMIDPHFREIDTCEWSFREFFELYLTDDYSLEYVLREKQFKKALKKNGELTTSEMYMFTPALALGGDENGNKTEKANIQVHLQFLFDLAQ